MCICLYYTILIEKKNANNFILAINISLHVNCNFHKTVGSTLKFTIYNNIVLIITIFSEYQELQNLTKNLLVV